MKHLSFLLLVAVVGCKHKVHAVQPDADCCALVDNVVEHRTNYPTFTQIHSLKEGWYTCTGDAGRIRCTFCPGKDRPDPEKNLPEDHMDGKPYVGLKNFGGAK